MKLACLLIISVSLLGCARSGNPEKQATPNESDNAPKLTEAEARNALIALVEKPHRRETGGLERGDDLRAGKALDFIAAKDEFVYHSETWTVCLERKTLSFLVRRGVHSWRLDGKFKNVDGVWVAEVTEETRAFHHAPKE